MNEFKDFVIELAPIMAHIMDNADTSFEIANEKMNNVVAFHYRRGMFHKSVAVSMLALYDMPPEYFSKLLYKDLLFPVESRYDDGYASRWVARRDGYITPEVAKEDPT